MGIGLLLAWTLGAWAEEPEPAPPRHVVGPSIVGGISGAYAVGATFNLLNLDNMAVGMNVGGLVGATGTYLLLRRGESVRTTGVRVGSLAGLGAFAGWQLSRLVIPLNARHAWDGALVGSAAGDLVGLGVGIGSSLGELTDREWLFLDQAVFAGWMAGGALNLGLGLSPAADRPITAAIGLGGAAVSFFPALWLVKQGAVKPEPARSALWSAQGAWIGGWIPSLTGANPPVRWTLMGASTGASVGWLASGLIPLGPTSTADQGVALLGVAAGTALGLGIPALVDGIGPRGEAWLAISGGLLGHAGGLLLARRLDQGRSSSFHLHLPARLAVAASPWRDEEGGLGLFVDAAISARERDRPPARQSP